MKDVRIEKGWRRALAAEFSKEYFDALSGFVKREYAKHRVYPPPKDIFRAFDLTAYDKVRVVILGQDPYHGKGQANGLSFAVHKGVALPPSLQNIFKEIATDLTIEQPKDGDLSRWARQGVLLLNATLTVREGSPASHHGVGWEKFTDAAIRALSNEREHLVFILWGRYAREKGAHIDRARHYVIESAHPSPFSANHGFFGSRPFSKTNKYLTEQGQDTIDWS